MSGQQHNDRYFHVSLAVCQMLRSHEQMLLNELSKCVYVHGLVFFEISTPISGRRATARPPNEWNAFNSSVVFGCCQQLLSSTGAQPSTMSSLGFFDCWTFPSNWYRRMIAVWYFCKRVMSKKCFRKYGVAAQLGNVRSTIKHVGQHERARQWGPLYPQGSCSTGSGHPGTTVGYGAETEL